MVAPTTQNGKPPSFSDAIEFEECFVGSILIAPELFSQADMKVRPDHFYDEELKPLYRLILECPEHIVSDKKLLIAEVQSLPSISAARVAEIFTKVPTPTHLKYYAEKVIAASADRQLFDFAGNLLKDASDKTIDFETKMQRVRLFPRRFETQSKLEPSALSFSQLQEQYGTQRAFLINEIAREREIIGLVAATKSGKSFLAMDLAMSVATGRKWLKSFNVDRPLKVLFVDGELMPDTLCHRMDRILYHRKFDEQLLEENFRAEPFRGRDAPDILQLERDYFNTFKPDQVDFVVIDCLYKFMPATWSENDHQNMARFVTCLDRIAVSLDCGVCVVHHSSKGEQGGKSKIEVGSGAGTFQRSVDTLLTIRPHEKEGYSVLESSSRSVPPIEPTSLFYTHPIWSIDLTEKPAVKQRKSLNEVVKKQEDDTAIAEICELGEFTAGSIRKEFGYGAGRISRLLRIAKKQELIEEVGMVVPQNSKKETELYRAKNQTCSGTCSEKDTCTS